MIVSNDFRGVDGRERLRGFQVLVHSLYEELGRAFEPESDAPLTDSLVEWIQELWHRYNERNAAHFFETGASASLMRRFSSDEVEDALQQAVVGLLSSHGRSWAENLPGFLDACVRRELARRACGLDRSSLEEEPRTEDERLADVDAWTMTEVAGWVAENPVGADALALASLGRGSLKKVASALGIQPGACRVRLMRARHRFAGFVLDTLAERGVDTETAKMALIHALLVHVETRIAERVPQAHLFSEVRGELHEVARRVWAEPPASRCPCSIQITEPPPSAPQDSDSETPTR